MDRVTPDSKPAPAVALARRPARRLFQRTTGIAALLLTVFQVAAALPAVAEHATDHCAGMAASESHAAMMSRVASADIAAGESAHTSSRESDHCATLQLGPCAACVAAAPAETDHPGVIALARDVDAATVNTLQSAGREPAVPPPRC